MNDMGWIIETIEREAMNRATLKIADGLAGGGDIVVLLGMTTRQILWLKLDYEARTGLLAESIGA